MYLRKIVIVIVFFLTVNSIAQEVKIEFTVNDGTAVQELNLGLDQTGTDGKDDIEVELPPVPPAGIFYSWIEIVDPTEGTMMVRDDYRAGDSTSSSVGTNVAHKIKWQLGENGVGPTICWDIYGVTLNLKDEFGGTFVNYDVNVDGPGCYTITEPSLTSLLVTVEYIKPPFTLSDKALLDLKVFMEGPYNSGQMSTGLNNDIPLSQPFTLAPWNFSGNESVTQVPTNIVDWVLVELRENTSSSVGDLKRAAFINGNGNIVDIDGISKLKFYNVTSDNYYVVIRHRNHLPIMSSNKISITR